MQEIKSEVAYLRKRILGEHQAAMLGLTGLSSGTSQHDFITAKMENMRKCQEQLNTLVGEQEATKIVAEVLENC